MRRIEAAAVRLEAIIRARQRRSREKPLKAARALALSVGQNVLVSNYHVFSLLQVSRSRTIEITGGTLEA